ncbi:MAG: biopolymer transporter ExbD [Gammaproteobacteria bacterium]|nr:biopolymer transporter ExbD [Gammaproteobacteria bacterium]MBL6999170.1 biopolymer transporter ExbD [Gammaproteobacteria bacterium]
MRFRTRVAEDDSGVNLTPLIDVVFLLLIFFMVSTTFDSTSELKIELPEASANKPAAPSRLTIIIDAEGLYYLNGKKLKNQSADLLLLEVHQLVADDKEMPVVIQSDARSPVQSLVTALDIVGQIGLSRLSIATTKSTR